MTHIEGTSPNGVHRAEAEPNMKHRSHFAPLPLATAVEYAKQAPFVGSHVKFDSPILENDFFPVRQAKLLGFSGGSVSSLPRPVCDGDLALMRRSDELHLDYPFSEVGFCKALERAEGWKLGGFTSPR